MDYNSLASKVFEVYTSKSVAQTDDLVYKLYAPTAVFSDNITYVSTVKEIALMFRGLAATFPTVEVQVHDVSATPAAEGAPATTVRPWSLTIDFRVHAVTSPTQVVSIKNTQTYHCKGMMARLAGNTVAIEVVSTLQLDEQNRIVHHQDTWQDRGSMPRFLRSMGGSLTNLILRMTGVARKTT